MKPIKNLGITAGLLYVFIDIFGLLSPLYVPTNSSQAATVWLAISPVFEVLFERVEVVGGILGPVGNLGSFTGKEASEDTELPRRGCRYGGRPLALPGS